MATLIQDQNKVDIEMMEDKRHLDRHLDESNVGHLANQEAHDETALEAVRLHPWTCVWIVYGIWILLCCSFDNSAAGSVVGIPRFRQDFGYPFEGDYVLPANWQSAYSGGPAAASVFGTFAGGYITDKIGRKWNTLAIYILLLVGISVETVVNTTANPNAVFFGGKFINGFATGSRAWDWRSQLDWRRDWLSFAALGGRAEDGIGEERSLDPGGSGRSRSQRERASERKSIGREGRRV